MSPVLHAAAAERHPSYTFDAVYRMRGTLSLASKAAFGMFDQPRSPQRQTTAPLHRIGGTHNTARIAQAGAPNRPLPQIQAASAVRRLASHRAIVVKPDSGARERIAAGLARLKAARQEENPAARHACTQRWYRVSASSENAVIICIVFRGRAFVSSRRLRSGRPS
ncbi:MAG: hypothetical protein DLM53_11205 [Candidatus Eremiobacter antarcticus]|nr:MAG: hypothetical protein DLM53_11205 [Candidatus Eremiobacter sp. RRmetagenome_bin22]